MKPSGLLPLLILATSLLAEEPPSTPAPAATPTQPPLVAATPAKDPVAKPAVPADEKLSPGVTQMLTANLPKYAPPAPASPATPAAEVSPDTLQLDKVVVKQKKRPRLGDEVMMTNKAFNEKLAKEKTSSFDRDFLNKYGFLGGASAADRAKDDYNREKRDQMQQDVTVMAKALDHEDPAAAKALRDAANKP